jgi:hypothetical protein
MRQWCLSSVIFSEAMRCEPTNIANAALTWEGYLRCKQSTPGDADWVLLGDSHAEHLFLGLADSNQSKNIAFYILGGKPYLGNDEFRAIFDELLEAQKSKTVFLTMHYVEHVETQDELYENFTSIVTRLTDVGHRVILIGDIPKYEIHPQDCLFGGSLEQAEVHCSMDIKTFEAQEAIFDNTLKAIAKAQNVTYLSLRDPLCEQDRCSMIRGETILYRDDNHLNIPGSIFIGRYLSGLL